MYKNDRARFYVQLEEWRSLCTTGGDVGVTARWQHAMFQGLEKRGEERIAGEGRMSSPVAWRGLGRRKEERRKEATKRNVTGG